jgi:VWFA-related protein
MLRSWGGFVVIVVLLLAASSPAREKERGGDANETPIFRAVSRVVLVDVIATDSMGNPVRELQTKDFEVFDNGKQQKIRSFEEHSTDGKVAVPEQPPVLPPGIYSNWAPAPPSGPTNVVLFDTLNMEWQDQVYARLKMVEYLKTLPRGQQVALFTLGSRLRMVQSFTGNSDTLIAAAKKLGALNAFSTPEGESQAAILDNLGESKPENSASGGNGTVQSATIAAMQASPSGVHTPASILQEFLDQEDKEVGGIRIRVTLEALRELAHALAPIPGRKNLIWISGNFPALIGSYTELSGLHLYDHEVRATAALLAAQQVAVYPIDARGLVTQPAEASAANSGRVLITPSRGGQNPYVKSINDFNQSLQATHDAMDELALQTGGRAFYNSNDIPRAIGRSIESGAHYYTLSYAPNNKNWDGRLRKIEVKVARQNVKLTYRRGYYAIADPFAPVMKIKTTSVDVQKLLIEAVQPNAPQLNGILMEARAVTSGPDKPVEVDYAIDPRNLSVSETENGKRKLCYQLAAVAWDKKGANAAQAWEMVDKEISPEETSDIFRQGIHSRRLLTLKPGDYSLYIGIIDVESRKMGVLTMPLRIPTQATK